MFPARSLLVVYLVLFAGLPANAQEWDQVEIRTEDLGSNLHVLYGRGGNIVLCSGEDGAFLVDAQFAPLSEKILARVAEITPEPVRFVINTHWHHDHTHGNPSMSQAGAMVVAHENVFRRVSTEQTHMLTGNTLDPIGEEGWPKLTFEDGLKFRWNGEEIRIHHIAHAHTDGDAIVHFVNANVIHAGDTFFNGLYPFIDTLAGGSIDGVMRATDRILELADEETMIVPGHGGLADRARLQAYRDMMATIRERITGAIAEGKSLAEAQSAGLTAEWDEEWGQSFIKPDKLVEILYQDLSQ